MGTLLRRQRIERVRRVENSRPRIRSDPGEFPRALRAARDGFWGRGGVRPSSRSAHKYLSLCEFKLKIYRAAALEGK
jgi:hypothetical protein